MAEQITIIYIRHLQLHTDTHNHTKTKEKQKITIINMMNQSVYS